MKQLLIILLSFITCFASAQVYQRMPQHGYEMDRGRILLDLDIPSDTTTNKSGVARIGTRLYAGNGTYWTTAVTSIDSTIFQTKYRSDTSRANIYYTIDTTGKVALFEDGSGTIRQSNDTLYFKVNGAGSAFADNYIITAPPIQLTADTVDVIPNIVFYQDGVRDTITTGAQYIVPYATAGYKRIDAIVIDNGVLDTLKGVQDTINVVSRTLTGSQILFAYIDVYGTDSIVVAQVGNYQRTAGVYIGADGKLKTDSANYYYTEALRRLTAGTFNSTVVGGVGYYLGDGSAIRVNGGSGVGYLDAGNSNTQSRWVMRTGSGYTNMLQLNEAGRVLIGTNGTADIPSARLAVVDSTKGFLPPVMRGVRMNGISSPATGLVVYNSDSASLCLYNGSAWVKLGSGGSTPTLQEVLTAGSSLTVNPNLINSNGNILQFEGNSTGNRGIVTLNNSSVLIAAYNGFGTGASFTMSPSVINLNASRALDANNYININSDSILINGLGANPAKVGIGTTTPTATLHVASSDSNAFRIVAPLSNSVVAGDSMAVIDAGGKFKKAVKPSGGAVDSSNFVTKTATQTITGQTTFSNSSVGSQNLLISGGRQTGSDNQGLVISGTYAGATNAHPLRISPTFSPTSNGFAPAAVDAPISTGGTANIDHIVGFQSVITHASSGTMTNAYGTYLGYINNGGVTTNAYGVHVINPTGSGTITNNVGIYVANQTKGATNLGLQIAGTTGMEVGGISYLLGNAIVGHTTGVAPGADLEVRNLGAVSFRMRNNANWFQFSQPSSSADISFGSISGNNMKIYDGGNKTFFAPAQDSVSNSGLWVNHSFATAYRSSTSTTITLNNNDFTFNSDATSGNVTVNLPTAVGCKGRIYTVRKLDASVNTVTIDGNSTETINGATTVVLSAQYSFRMMQSDGANWMVISQL